MMTVKEVRAAIYGVVELARGDIIGLTYFDGSITGFWRSFWAAAIVAPAWILLLALDEQPMSADGLRIVVVQIIDYALLWTAFPLVLYEILSRRGKTERFCLYISIHNWASVIETPAMLFAAAFAVAVPSGFAQLVPLIAMVGIFAYECFLARAGLAVGFGIAIAVAGLDFILSMIIQLTADFMLGVGTVIDSTAGLN
jgi:hypothetical protein